MVNIDMHHQLLYLQLERHNLLVSLGDLLVQLVDLALQAVADLIVFEVSDPVENVLSCLLLEHVLL